jgi:hypothetical protein
MESLTMFNSPAPMHIPDGFLSIFVSIIFWIFSIVFIGGVLLTLALTILSPLASSHPDGLEWAAEEHGFLMTTKESFYQIIPDYALPGITNEKFATITAGIIGAMLVFSIAYFTAKSRNQRKSIQQ